MYMLLLHCQTNGCHFKLLIFGAFKLSAELHLKWFRSGVVIVVGVLINALHAEHFGSPL